MPYAGHFDEFGKVFVRPGSESHALAGIGPQDASPAAGRNLEEAPGQAVAHLCPPWKTTEYDR